MPDNRTFDADQIAELVVILKVKAGVEEQYTLQLIVNSSDLVICDARIASVGDNFDNKVFIVQKNITSNEQTITVALNPLHNAGECRRFVAHTECHKREKSSCASCCSSRTAMWRV